ncbi:MFS general substrate transporter [Wolfiporia cocos MD-104 SS10]|uniref:MFS general substrate transporter n=1 Tax=Wolfiporia cocos (strain MD-104) TaxID=742152 RepID=A0A2H3JNB4_WOLCO|nr:MFS general substrate transporter [Wolfiporia cocos MD-104 SS10]
MSEPVALELHPPSDRSVNIIKDKPPSEIVVSEDTNSQPVEIPDGGLQAWLSVLGGFLVLFVTFGYSNSFGVFQDYYTLKGASSSSNISWIGSVQLFLTFFMGLPAGRLFDKGYFHVTNAIGSFLFVFCMFMLSLADPSKYYQLILSQGVGLGLGSGLLLVPAQSVQAHHWKKHRAFAMGIVASGISMVLLDKRMEPNDHPAGSGFGGIVYPIMLNQLINGSVGFAWGVRAAAFLTLGLLVVANLTMTTRLPSAKNRPAQPKVDIKAILFDSAYTLVEFGFFFTLWGLYYPYFYLQLWMNTHGLSATVALYSIAIMNAGSIPGRIVLNILADSYGQFNVLCPVILAMGALVFAMFGLESVGAVIVFAILYGFFSGCCMSLLYATLLASLANSMEEVGIRLGIVYCVGAFAFLTGTPIDGALLGSVDAWYKPTVFSGVFMSLSLHLLKLTNVCLGRTCKWRCLCNLCSYDIREEKA